MDDFLYLIMINFDCRVMRYFWLGISQTIGKNPSRLFIRVDRNLKLNLDYGMGSMFTILAQRKPS